MHVRPTVIVLVGSRGCIRTYIYEHGEVGPPAAQWWELIIAEARMSRVEKRSQAGDPFTEVVPERRGGNGKIQAGILR